MASNSQSGKSGFTKNTRGTLFYSKSMDEIDNPSMIQVLENAYNTTTYTQTFNKKLEATGAGCKSIPKTRATKRSGYHMSSNVEGEVFRHGNPWNCGQTKSREKFSQKMPSKADVAVAGKEKIVIGHDDTKCSKINNGYTRMENFTSDPIAAGRKFQPDLGLYSYLHHEKYHTTSKKAFKPPMLLTGFEAKPDITNPENKASGYTREINWNPYFVRTKYNPDDPCACRY